MFQCEKSSIKEGHLQRQWLYQRQLCSEQNCRTNSYRTLHSYAVRWYGYIRAENTAEPPHYKLFQFMKNFRSVWKGIRNARTSWELFNSPIMRWLLHVAMKKPNHRHWAAICPAEHCVVQQLINDICHKSGEVHQDSQRAHLFPRWPSLQRSMTLACAFFYILLCVCWHSFVR